MKLIEIIYFIAIFILLYMLPLRHLGIISIIIFFCIGIYIDMHPKMESLEYWVFMAFLHFLIGIDFLIKAKNESSTHRP